MTSKKYLIYLFILLIAGISYHSRFIALNFSLNPFGLWYNNGGKKIYGNERTSKYLLSIKYIPDNFDGVLIGSSVSDNLDTRKLSNYKIYNLSLNGGNISEIKYIANNYIKRHIEKVIIICLHPYITKNHGFKDDSLKYQNILDASLFSQFAINITKKLFYDIDPPKGFQESEWGWNDFNLIKIEEGITFDSYLKNEILDKERTLVLDREAYIELREVINFCKEKKFKILAFFYPINYWSHQTYVTTGHWQQYKRLISGLFSKEDVLWDMNTKHYHYITKNMQAYTDAHLSREGAELVLQEINKKLQDSVN